MPFPHFSRHLNLQGRGPAQGIGTQAKAGGAREEQAQEGDERAVLVVVRILKEAGIQEEGTAGEEARAARQGQVRQEVGARQNDEGGRDTEQGCEGKEREGSYHLQTSDLPKLCTHFEVK